MKCLTKGRSEDSLPYRKGSPSVHQWEWFDRICGEKEKRSEPDCQHKKRVKYSNSQTNRRSRTI